MWPGGHGSGKAPLQLAATTLARCAGAAAACLAATARTLAAPLWAQGLGAAGAAAALPRSPGNVLGPAALLGSAVLLWAAAAQYGGALPWAAAAGHCMCIKTHSHSAPAPTWALYTLEA